VSHERHVMALLKEANPAPPLGDDAYWTDLDAATYLATLEQRISEMTKLETNENQQDTPRQWNRPWLVAAVFVLVLGVGVVVFNQVGPAPVGGLPAIPLDGADDHPGAAEAFSAVEEAYHLHNTGDPRWIEIRGRGSNVGTPDEEEATKEAVRQFWTALIAADPRYNVSVCVSNGSGEWAIADPGVPTPVGHYFVCEATYSDALLEVAGVHPQEEFHWVVGDEGIVAARSNRETEDDVVFVNAFKEWLTSTHPEEASELSDLLDAPGFGFADPQVRSQILGYAEEFVAESDVYPLEGTGS